MRKMVVKIASLATLLLLASVVLGQPQAEDQKAKKKGGLFNQESSTEAKSGKTATSTLEQLLAQAMQNNPDMRVAEAKVREAEAELHRIRLQVAQKLIPLHYSIEAQKAAIAVAETQYKRVLDGRGRPAGSREYRSQVVEADQAQSALETAKATLATLDAEMSSLLGKLPQGLTTRGSVRLRDMSAGEALFSALLKQVVADDFSSVAFSPDSKVIVPLADGTVRVLDPANAKQLRLALDSAEILSAKPPMAGSMADRIRKALDTPITVEYKEKPLADVLKDLQQKTPGVTFITPVPRRMLSDALTLHLPEPLPLAAVLQAIEDAGGLRFYVREYGFLVIAPDYSAPDGATPLAAFMKSRVGGDKPKTGEVEGVVKAVDSESGYVTLTVGSDAGLSKGNTLEVYRLKPEPAYLGTVEVLSVQPALCVAKPVARLRGTIQVGDRVSSSFPGAKR